MWAASGWTEEPGPQGSCQTWSLWASFCPPLLPSPGEAAVWGLRPFLSGPLCPLLREHRPRRGFTAGHWVRLEEHLPNTPRHPLPPMTSQIVLEARHQVPPSRPLPYTSTSIPSAQLVARCPWQTEGLGEALWDRSLPHLPWPPPGAQRVPATFLCPTHGSKHTWSHLPQTCQQECPRPRSGASTATHRRLTDTREHRHTWTHRYIDTHGHTETQTHTHMDRYRHIDTRTQTHT